MTNTLDWVLLIFGCSLTAQWLWVIAEALRFESSSRSLLRQARLPVHKVFVSVVVPARNEADAIAECLNSLVRIQPNDSSQESSASIDVEVIAIDDRSDDRTGEIMDEFARQFSGRLKVVHVKELPPGWLGKTHALHLGARAARASSQFILFTDGDVNFAPNSIRTALAIAEGNQLDHLVLAPKFLSRTRFLAAMQCFFGVNFLMLTKPSRIGRAKKYYVGAGAFNLVRRVVYEKFGGHEALKLEVIDDIMLGKLMVANGGSQALLDGRNLISLHWYLNSKAMVHGLEKNAFASMRYSYLAMTIFSLSVALIYFSPYLILVLCAGPPILTTIFVVERLLMHTLFAGAAYRMNYPIWLTLLMPFAACAVLFAFLRSTFLAAYRGKIIWRDTSYSVADLKRNMI